MLKYAAIYTDRITPQYIELIRTTGVNSYSDSFLRTKPGYTPEMVLISWDEDIAVQIPEAMAAIQQIIDEGVIIRDELGAKDYVNDPSSPFYHAPPQ
jgi:hypothetical protein